MDSFSNLFKREHSGELVLTVIFIVYLILGAETPESVSFLLDNIGGKIIVFAVIIYMFLHMNPILAILGLFVAFELMRRSSSGMYDTALQTYMPSENNKMNKLTAFNQFPYTLEQEVVKKMAPILQSGSVLTKPSYKPMFDDFHDASPINVNE
jgi:hypothetical protein